MTRRLWMAALALVLGGVALARPPGGGEVLPDPGAMVARMTQHLDLDEATADAVLVVLEQARADGDALRERLDDLHDAMEAERLAEPLNLPKVEKLIRQIASARADLEIHRLRTMEDVLKVLPADKAAKLRAHLRERGERWREGQGPPPDAGL